MQRFRQEVGKDTIFDIVDDLPAHIGEDDRIDGQLKEIIGQELGKFIISNLPPIAIDSRPEIEKDRDIKGVSQDIDDDREPVLKRLLPFDSKQGDIFLHDPGYPITRCPS
jgi:hypothetical protein